ncbi:MAG: threonine/serine dehydratase [Acidobacteria bacterium]|nr:MAG: threonine/serine dehydratase [Acidobacteriota bacterium]
MSLNEVTLTAIEAARARIAGRVRRTPIAPSATFSRELGTHIYFKQELFQKTGSFKVRGAFNKMLPLPAGSRVVAVSGGNHAQAVAYAASELGMHARILMPQTTPANYVAATHGYGAEVVLAPSIADAFAQAEAAVGQGWTMVHPFDDPAVMAGQGTVALEILEDVPELTDVIVSIGGGGLMTGVVAAVKARKPQARVWGVETEGADAMAQALAAGKIVRLPAITSIAKTLGAPAVSETTLAAARQWLESVTVVSDHEAVEALRFLLERSKLLTEPAASCTLAAARRLASHFTPSSHVVLILCGGNLALNDLCAWNASGL